MLKLASTAREVKVASPYVTEFRLFKTCISADRSLFTAFNALSFISGASSLKILRCLVEAGVKVYHVEFLHAKVVLIDGEHFSLGSQNMTVRGRRKNIEASFVSGTVTPTVEIVAFFEKISMSARPVSLREIIDMEEAIKPWIRKFKEINTAAEEIDDTVRANAERREATKKRMLNALRKRQKEQEKEQKNEERKELERRGAMQRALILLDDFSKAPQQRYSPMVAAAVEHLTNRTKHLLWGQDTYTESLRPIYRHENFESLLLSLKITPKRLRRYLLINTDTGRLGLVRFAKTQWTFFGDGVSYANDRLNAGGGSWKVEVTFDWTNEGGLLRNGYVILKSESAKVAPKIKIGFAFSITGVELVHDLPLPTILRQSGFLSLYNDSELTEDMDSKLRSFLIEKLTHPFKYASNLTGKQALSFFGERYPTVYEIRAHRLGDTVVLTARLRGGQKKKTAYVPAALNF